MVTGRSLHPLLLIMYPAVLWVMDDHLALYYKNTVVLRGG
jgi:hypothetical protein